MMPLSYPYKDCPWNVRHRIDGEVHHAWRMRAFMVGDFLKKRPARSDFIIEKDGTPANWRRRPKCETCGQVPETDDLVVVERATGDKHFLDIARDERRGARAWAETKEDRCRWCQAPQASINEDRLCPRCAELDAKPAPPKQTPGNGPDLPPNPPLGHWDPPPLP